MSVRRARAPPPARARRSSRGFWSGESTLAKSLRSALAPSASRCRQKPLGGVPLEQDAEDAREVLRVSAGRGGRLDVLSCEPFHRRRSLIHVTAGDYAVEITKVGR